MAFPAPLPRRSTLGDDVYETLRALVLEHTLTPGERLNIDALSRNLEVSPTPVREALARLESEGLIRKRPLVGYTVSPLLTRAEFTEMFDMRLLLHDLVAQASGNALLHDSISRLHAHLHLHRRYFPYAQTAITVVEHQRVAAAIRDGQPEPAELAMRDHLTRARERHLVAFD
jgi:DNA-binding GntR family transcriptional regulator